MSILIKGMEMPKNCYLCHFVFRNKGDERVFCTAKDPMFDISETLAENRADDCPLIELPPHGRLIDADEMVASVKRQTEIMREIAKEVDKLKPIANSKELDDVDIVAIAETVEKGVLQEIANAPTILEAEVEDYYEGNEDG